MLIDVQDHVLTTIADMAYYSAAVAERMPSTAAWSFRNRDISSSSSAVVGDPGTAFRHAILGTLTASSSTLTDKALQNAFVQIVSESESKRRRALLRVAMQPMLAVEKSKMFEKSKPTNAAAKPHPSSGSVVVDASTWSNKRAGQSTSLLDTDDDLFDLSHLMP
ncbi:hypothetical protein GGI21_003039 [Coemansia aciculifera]|nr:hypothetical protein GGI21_003039 [Coemansia aciculifera]